jgi:hypothetical protein
VSNEHFRRKVFKHISADEAGIDALDAMFWAGVGIDLNCLGPIHEY